MNGFAKSVFNRMQELVGEDSWNVIQQNDQLGAKLENFLDITFSFLIKNDIPFSREVWRSYEQRFRGMFSTSTSATELNTRTLKWIELYNTALSVFSESVLGHIEEVLKPDLRLELREYSRIRLNGLHSEPLAQSAISDSSPIKRALETASANDFKLFFSSRLHKRYYVALELAKLAGYHMILPNEFDDDATVNHLVIFRPDQIDDLIQMHEITKHQGNFFRGMWGYRILGAPVEHISRDLVSESLPPRKINPFCVHLTRDSEMDSNASENAIINLVKVHANKSEREIARYIWYKYMLPIQNEFDKVNDFVNSYFASFSYSEKHMKRELTAKWDQMYSELVMKGKAPVKWKSEKQLFELVSKFYPDAIYQCYPEWITPQSYDVYVPSIDVAFEYQGIQHFEAVEFFGGQQSLLHRQYLDERKRVATRKHGTHLIEWRFDEPITVAVLKDKLQTVHQKLQI